MDVYNVDASFLPWLAWCFELMRGMMNGAKKRQRE